jgi:hypothetical protein
MADSVAFAENNDDGAPIGSVRPTKISGVSITKRATSFGAPRFTAAATPKPTVASSRVAATPKVATVKPVDTVKPTVRFAEEPAVMPVIPELVVSEAAEEPEEKIDLTAFVAAAGEAPVEEEKEKADVAAIKEKLAGVETVARMTNPPPEDAPVVPLKEFFREESKQLQSLILTKPQVDVQPPKVEGPDGKETAPVYRPITAPAFRRFIVQTYNQYSPFLQKLIATGRRDRVGEEEIDKDACKRRDPNKVETFYYQKFVRDYLSRGSPYRGLLVYHGLGSGKTCTSIAAAEALYWGGQKTIYVLTPATLSNNYRRELGKCGYFPFKSNNHWEFLQVRDPSKPQSVEFYWLETVLGLPRALIQKQGGGWVPNPDRPSNWDSLSPQVRESIRFQQAEHLAHRFKFIHYNGVTPAILAQLASAGVKEGKSVFDDAVIIVDEIHNLVRTINGTQIGGKPISTVIEKVEPREFSWSTPLGRERPGFRYPRGYTLYRLIQNAVGAKIVALSATPMINYAQEMAILMNLVGGEIRMTSISLKAMARDPGTLKRLEAWAQQHPQIDFYTVEEAVDRTTVLNLTPVPFGYAKVLPGGNFAERGFVRQRPSDAGKVEASRERNMDTWTVALLRELEAGGFITAGTAEEAATAVAAARASGPGTVPKTKAFTLHTLPMLPEDPKEFVSHFVNRNTLEIMNANVLKARASGLISYYRGGSKELMPHTVKNVEVKVPMSEYMFQEYSKARAAELEMEGVAPEVPEAGTGAEPAKRRGMTAAEQDLYSQATKTQQTGFLALSRAACNWVFPEDVPRPKISVKQQTKLLGIEVDGIVAADSVVDVDADLEVAERGPVVADGDAETTAAVLPDEPAAVAAPSALDSTLSGILGTLMSGLEVKADEYLNEGLDQFSPKYAAILGNIRASPGPVLVYSQFKTLEGLGIFAAALRAAPEKYLPLDIQKNSAGEWEIPEGLLTGEAAGRPRYILYTGDQELEKRRYLLQLYNADVAGLPPRLSAQCAALLAGAPDNRDGRVCRIFMITQSGAEGISLFNTRQVHVMEPYWNNVRIQQVVGRAIRLCSHMNLPWDDRTVDVFTYLSVFSDKQKAEGSKQLMMADKGMTTDQMIFDIATKKQKLADGLMEIAQSAAVDCDLHFHEHGEATQCFSFSEAGGPMFMYHPEWRKDLAAGVRKVAGK